jgi:hypothetical protein
LTTKFRATARGLQAWSDKKVGHVESQLALAREILHQLEIAQDLRLLTHLEVELKNNLKKHSLALASFKRTIARSRSRIQWLKEGDVRHRKGKNFISRLVSDNGTCTSHDDKAKLIHQFYDGLLGTAWNREHTIDLHTSFGYSCL